MALGFSKTAMTLSAPSTWLEAVRRRPGMYVGGTDETALHCCVIQLIANSLQEHSAGRGLSISVTIHNDGSLSVKDDGGGISVVPVPEHQMIPFIELALTTAYLTDYSKNHDCRVLELRGVGTKCVNALSEWMRIRTVWEGNEYHLAFARGRISEPLAKQLKSAATCGTTITFKPDSEIFRATHFDRNKLARQLDHLAVLHPALEFWLVDERPNTANRPLVALFHYPNGIADFLKASCSAESRRHPEPVVISSDSNGIKIALGFQFTETGNTSLLSFVNSSPTICGGTHVDGFLQGLADAFNELGRPRQLFHRNQMRNGLNAFVGVWLRDPHYGGATKDELINPEVKTAIRAATLTGVRRWISESGKQGEWLVESFGKGRKTKR